MRSGADAAAEADAVEVADAVLRSGDDTVDDADAAADAAMLSGEDAVADTAMLSGADAVVLLSVVEEVEAALDVVAVTAAAALCVATGRESLPVSGSLNSSEGSRASASAAHAPGTTSSAWRQSNCTMKMAAVESVLRL